MPRKAKTGQGWPVLPTPGAMTKRGNPKRSVGPYGGASVFCLLFVAMTKSESRVRRETKRPAHAVMKTNEKAKELRQQAGSYKQNKYRVSPRARPPRPPPPPPRRRARRREAAARKGA